MWRPLEAFSDPRVPKLHHLARARRLGLEVPPTRWLPVSELKGDFERFEVAPSEHGWFIRSASPDEDGTETSNAGKFLSLPLDAGASREVARDVVEQVAASMGPKGIVFVQPRIVGESAGVAFFDGFWFEKTEAPSTNYALTHGEARGVVLRGHLRAPDAWSRFLDAAHRLVGHAAVDVEFVRTGTRFILLQARPALFEIRRNPLLSMANHREILGEVPSPWVVSVLESAGRQVVSWFSAVDSEVSTWGESYAVVVHGRPWMNFSFFLRLLRHWGLPEHWMTRSVGGASDSLEQVSSHFAVSRIKPLKMVHLQLRGLARVRNIRRRLQALSHLVGIARTPIDLMLANISAMEFAITTNFAIAGILTANYSITKLAKIARRKKLSDDPAGEDHSHDIITREMMTSFDALRTIPVAERRPALERWLARHGHRGPLESDPERPRFREIRPRLEAELGLEATAAPHDTSAVRPQFQSGPHLLPRPEALRERFRDDLMHLWEQLRERALELGEDLVSRGVLDRREDLFLLDLEACQSPEGTWRERVSKAAEARERHLGIDVPVTASRDVLESLRPEPVYAGELRGIGLGHGLVRGRVRRARELDEVLGEGQTGMDILVVPSLEPSWAVVFSKFVAIVSELGGELSHAAILLREARIPAVVDCRGAFRALATGTFVEVDVTRGLVRLAP